MFFFFFFLISFPFLSFVWLFSLSPPSAFALLAAPAPASETKRGVAVTKWVDYSFKYGLGYQLSNGTVGVFFNDHTKIALASDLT